MADNQINASEKSRNEAPQESCEGQDKISTRKLSRSVITGVAASKLGAKHLGYLGKRALSKKDQHEALEKKHHKNMGRLLFGALSQLRGTALKASQILSTEASFLPENLRIELAKACYQVPPINKALIRKAFRQEFQQSPEQLFGSFNSEAFAAASIGQVHKATTKSGETLAVKIQYPGIAASIDSDLQLLQGLLNTLANTWSGIPNKVVIAHTMAEIKARLHEEVDYHQEAQYTQWFSEQLDASRYAVPTVYSEYSSKRILTTGHLEGLHLDQWLATDPSQAQRNHFGQLLFDYFLQSNFQLKAINPDFHPGNFLFMPDNRLGIIDFGCVKNLADDYPKKITQLFSSFKNAQSADNIDEMLASYSAVGLISKDLDRDVFIKDIKPSCDQITLWFIEPFMSDKFHFKNKSRYPADVHKTGISAVKHMTKLREEQMSFDRGYLGLMEILCKMEAEVVTQNPWLG